MKTKQFKSQSLTTYRIKWLQLSNNKILYSLSTYTSIEEAESQIKIWSNIFPCNKYFIVPIHNQPNDQSYEGKYILPEEK